EPKIVRISERYAEAGTPNSLHRTATALYVLAAREFPRHSAAEAHAPRSNAKPGKHPGETAASQVIRCALDRRCRARLSNLSRLACQASEVVAHGNTTRMARITARRLSELAIMGLFLALVRTLAEYYRLRYVRGTALGLSDVAPYITGG